ncbi:MAG: zf-HC2 domain-containing protein [Planctomycetales bacterium]|nr:zf-HC2 domain-containing protein [Planctomycetales bacterium]
MNCAEVQENLIAFLLHELPTEEAQVMQEHLDSGCGDCLAQRSILDESLENLFSQLPGDSISEQEVHQIQQDVRARIRLSQNPADLITISKPNWRQYSVQLTMALSLGIAAALLGPWIAQPWSHPDSRVVHLEPMPARAQEPVMAFSKVRFTSSRVPIAAQLIYDAFSAELHFFSTELPALQQGEQLELVLVTPTGEVVQSIPLTHSAAGGRAVMPNVTTRDISSCEFLLRVELPDSPASSQSSPAT